jgi:hypothetical protein
MSSRTPTPGSAVTRVPTATLEALLRSIHRQRLPMPLSRSTLIAGGFGNVEGDLGSLQGLDARAAQAVIVAAIAERRAAATHVALAACGADTSAHLEVVRGARHDVFVAGYDAGDTALLDALEALPRPAVHLAWIASAGSPSPSLACLDVWTPPAEVASRTLCLIADTARVLLGDVRTGPAVFIEDPTLARALTAEWRAHLADAGYALRPAS